MHKCFIRLLGGAALLITLELPLRADDNKIQTFVDSTGRQVFTNLGENGAGAASLPRQVLTETDPLIRQMPPALKSLVDVISVNHGVDPALVRAVMKTESNFNRWAVSNKGAMGLMQLIPATGRRFGVSDFYDPKQNIEGGVRYLRFLLDKFDGNIDLSLAAYNAGENLVARLGRIPAIKETTNYVRKIRAIYRNPSAPVAVAANRAAAETISTAAANVAAEPVARKVSEVRKDVPEVATDVRAEEPQKIYRSVDSRGVVRFSNLGPPN